MPRLNERVGRLLPSTLLLGVLTTGLLTASEPPDQGSIDSVPVFETRVDKDYLSHPDISSSTMDSLKQLTYGNYPMLRDSVAWRMILTAGEQFAANGFGIKEITRRLRLRQVYPDSVFYFGPTEMGAMQATLGDASELSAITFHLELHFVESGLQSAREMSVSEMHELAQQLAPFHEQIKTVAVEAIRASPSAAPFLETVAASAILGRLRQEVLPEIQEMAGRTIGIRHVSIRRLPENG